MLPWAVRSFVGNEKSSLISSNSSPKNAVASGKAVKVDNADLSSKN